MLVTALTNRWFVRSLSALTKKGLVTIKVPMFATQQDLVESVDGKGGSVRVVEVSNLVPLVVASRNPYLVGPWKC